MSMTRDEYVQSRLDAVPRFESGRMLTHEHYLGTVSLLQDIVDVGMPSGVDRKDCFRTAWITGGAEGGDCWGGSPTIFVGTEKDRHLDILVDVLESLDVRLREANAILALVETGTFEELGYYGNFTEYAWKAVSYDVVYDKLVEFGYAEPRPDASPAP